jgi:P-type E1-E2 ATPase
LLEVEIPGRKIFKLDNLVLDINGTIALDGDVKREVVESIKELTQFLSVYIVTAGTHGKLDKLEKALEIEIYKIEPSKEAEQKQKFVKNLGAEKTASIGNGSNDALMLKNSAIGIAVIGDEGASIEAIFSADVVVSNINNALDLFTKPKRLIATLRK